MYFLALPSSRLGVQKLKFLVAVNMNDIPF
jgi:hypothetical protein